MLRDDIRAFEDAAKPLRLNDELTLEELDRRLDTIEHAARLREKCCAAEAWKDLGGWHQAMETDGDTLLQAAAWVEMVTELRLPDAAELHLVGDSPSEACIRLATHVQELQSRTRQWHEHRQQFGAFGRLSEEWLPIVDDAIENVIGPNAVAQLLELRDQLPEWSAFCRVLLRCEAENLTSFTTLALDGKVELDELSECFRLSVLERTVESKLWNNPSLKDFSRQTLEKAREHYKQLDRQLLQFTREQIAYDSHRRVEVFSSMKSSDILGGPDRSLGVNAMKDYLEFTRTGSLPDRGLYTGRPPDSPFELAVGSVITKMGLEVVPQVGVAGFFIDLGVLRPGTTGDFLLGIECDGATYHSAKSARDRDRLREEVIRRRGWNLHRIWSTDWFLNQKHEEQRLMQAIQVAMSNGSDASSPP